MERFVLWHRILPPAFEEEETTAAAGQWARYVTHEVQNSGGEVISSLAGTVVANFDTVLAEAPIGQPTLRSAPDL